MLPMLAGPLGKILGIGVILLALFLAGEWHGRSAIQQRFDAAIAKQAIASAETVVKQAENTAKVEVRYIKVKGQTEIVHDILEKEVKIYVDRPVDTCRVLDPEFVRVFDRIGRVYNDAADGVPPGGDAARAPDESAASPVEPAALLYAQLDTVTQLADLWNAYHALVEWVRTNYRLETEGAGRRAIREEHDHDTELAR